MGENGVASYYAPRGERICLVNRHQSQPQDSVLHLRIVSHSGDYGHPVHSTVEGLERHLPHQAWEAESPRLGGRRFPCAGSVGLSSLAGGCTCGRDAAGAFGPWSELLSRGGLHGVKSSLSCW